MKAAILPAGGVSLRLAKDLIEEDGHALLWSRSAREASNFCLMKRRGKRMAEGLVPC